LPPYLLINHHDLYFEGHLGAIPHLTRFPDVMATSFPDYYGLFGVRTSGDQMASDYGWVSRNMFFFLRKYGFLERSWYDKSLEFGVSIFQTNQFRSIFQAAGTAKKKGFVVHVGRCQEVRM
jgi:hypothetical protein